MKNFPSCSHTCCLSSKDLVRLCRFQSQTAAAGSHLSVSGGQALYC